MTLTGDALEQLHSALARVLRFDAAAGFGDDELLATMSSLEALGRLVDAHRAALAGEVAERSRIELGERRLSARKGCRSAVELIERLTQVSGFEARRRIALGSATRTRAGFTGETLDAAFPAVAAALASGALGADAAGVIIRELDRTRVVADPTARAAAEQALVAEATGSGEAAPVRCTADELRVQRRPGRRSSTRTDPNPTTNARCAAAGSGSGVPGTGSSRSPASCCPKSPRDSPACSTRTSPHAPAAS